MKIVSIYPNLDARGGAQDVLVQLAIQLNQTNKSIILTNTPVERIAQDYNKEELVFQRFSFSNIRCLAKDKEVIFLSHHRKLTSVLYVYLWLLGCSDRLVHVAHSVFTNLKWFTWLPKNIIAVSYTVKNNLIKYFGVKEENINIIYNGFPDNVKQRSYSASADAPIKIILAGRICALKQQIAIVQHIQERLPDGVEIYFAGVGEQLEALKQIVDKYEGYHTLGFIDIAEEIYNYDYMLLFSTKEGLPLSLIEGLRSGTPLITNKVGAVLEVNQEGETGYVFNDFDALLDGLKTLPHPSSQKYAELSKNARKRYEQYFKEEQMIEEYRNYLTQILQ